MSVDLDFILSDLVKVLRKRFYGCVLPLAGKKEVELETRWLRKYKVLMNAIRTEWAELVSGWCWLHSGLELMCVAGT